MPAALARAGLRSPRSRSRVVVAERYTGFNVSAASSADRIEIWRTTEIETPLSRYSKRPTRRRARRAAVSRSAPARRTTRPRSAPATSQTRTYQTIGAAAWRDSSSSGSASPIRGPGSCGRTRYSQPVAATRRTSTANGRADAYAARSLSRRRGRRARRCRARAPSCGRRGRRRSGARCRSARAPRRTPRSGRGSCVLGSGVEPDGLCLRCSAAPRAERQRGLFAASARAVPKIARMWSARS